MPAPKVAVRAVNQYRTRDIFAYLGLRYYLANSCASNARWIEEVCTNLVSSRLRSGYLKVQHFKDISDAGCVEHRDIYVPGPVEALAESSLIAACHEAGGPFVPGNRVYSYLAPRSDEISGVFRNYFDGLRARHSGIAGACREQPGASVAFYDIRKFYPSIVIGRAREVWEAACREASVAPQFTRLGNELLDRHGDETGALLTGPMFSHLIGNLLLRRIDESFSTGEASYFRYVDDITFVGNSKTIADAHSRLQGSLDTLQLTLHEHDSPKSLNIPGKEWLEGEHDFSSDHNRPSWMTLVGDVKCLLLWKPEQSERLRQLLLEHDVRLPLTQYYFGVKEYGFLARIRASASKGWWRAKSLSVSPESILHDALVLRRRYDAELVEILELLDTASPFLAKRMIPKARYRMGRLAYLATSERLSVLSQTSRPSLAFQAVVCRAIATRDLDALLGYGSNAVQAAAQVLRVRDEPILVSRRALSDVEEQSLCVAHLNGLSVGLTEDTERGPDSLKEFCLNGGNAQMMESRIPFLSEVACLHGNVGSSKHRSILDTAFDPDEELAMDVVEQGRSSLSG